MSQEIMGKPVDTGSKKKGNASWKPREEVRVDNMMSKDFRYRMVSADDYRIATLIEQGWELCSAINGERTYKGANAASKVIGGTSLDSVIGDRDRVMMRLPLVEASKRDAHYETKALSRLKGLKKVAKENVGESLTGKISIGGVSLTEIED